MNKDKEITSLVYSKLIKEDERIGNLQKREGVLNSFFRELIVVCIVLYCGAMIQKEIIKQVPELEQEVKRSYQRALAFAIIVTLLIGLFIWSLSK